MNSTKIAVGVGIFFMAAAMLIAPCIEVRNTFKNKSNPNRTYKYEVVLYGPDKAEILREGTDRYMTDGGFVSFIDRNNCRISISGTCVIRKIVEVKVEKDLK